MTYVAAAVGVGERSIEELIGVKDGGDYLLDMVAIKDGIPRQRYALVSEHLADVGYSR